MEKTEEKKKKKTSWTFSLSIIKKSISL